MIVAHFKFVIIFFGVFYIPTISGQHKCPTGRPSTTESCNSVHSCPSDSICYKKNETRFCCDELDTFCPTKMYTFNSKDATNSYLWGPGKFIDKDKWYNIELGGETVACPNPFSFAYLEYHQNILPVDFDPKNVKSSIPKSCKINSDCKVENEEYCGESSNPSFDNNLDKSGKNKVPLRFCYKFHTFGLNKIKPIIKEDKTGLMGCNNNSDCFIKEGSHAFCFIKDLESTFQFVDKDGKVTPMFGVCVMAHVCDLAKHVSIVASLTKNSTFCTTSKDCHGIGSTKEHSELEPECVDGPDPSKSEKICCMIKKNEKKEIVIDEKPLLLPEVTHSRNDSTFWFHTLLFSIASTFVFLIITIIFGVLYRFPSFCTKKQKLKAKKSRKCSKKEKSLTLATTAKKIEKFPSPATRKNEEQPMKMRATSPPEKIKATCKNQGFEPKGVHSQ